MPKFNHAGQFLRKLRLEKGKSQAEVARGLKDVHVQFVSNWERGLCAPPRHALKQLFFREPKQIRQNYFECCLLDAREELRERLKADGVL